MKNGTTLVPISQMLSISIKACVNFVTELEKEAGKYWTPEQIKMLEELIDTVTKTREKDPSVAFPLSDGSILHITDHGPQFEDRLFVMVVNDFEHKVKGSKSFTPDELCNALKICE